MKIDEIIEQFLEGKIKAKEVNELFESGELTLDDIRDKFQFGKLIQDLNKKYSEIMTEAVILPHSISWKDTIIVLMIAIENKEKVLDVANKFYIYNDEWDY